MNVNETDGDEKHKHFYTMIKNPDIYHEQWHTLEI